MIILQESASAQTIKFIPRALACDTLVVEDEATNTAITHLGIVPDIDRYYLEVSTVFTLVEGRSYTLKVLNGSDVVYKDKIFCTNQDIEDYSINDGEYVDHETNDDFVIIS